MTKEELREYRRAYYRTHRQKILQDLKEKYATDEAYRNKRKADARQYEIDNKESVAKAKAEYQKKNKEKFKEYNANYYQENIEQIKKRKKEKYSGEKIITRA